MKQVVEQDLHIPVANMKLFRGRVGDGGGRARRRAEPRGARAAGGRDLKLELRIVYLQEHAQPTDYTMPDVIDVEVHFGADIPPKLMQVPIERVEGKPFLGGFRSKKTGAEFHHACSRVAAPIATAWPPAAPPPPRRPPPAARV